MKPTKAKDTYTVEIHGSAVEVYFPAPKLPMDDDVNQDPKTPYSYETACKRDTYYFVCSWLERPFDHSEEQTRERKEFLNRLYDVEDARELDDGTILKKGKNTYFYLLLDRAVLNQREEQSERGAGRAVVDNWEQFQEVHDWEDGFDKLPSLQEIDARIRARNVSEALIFTLNSLKDALNKAMVEKPSTRE